MNPHTRYEYVISPAHRWLTFAVVVLAMVTLTSTIYLAVTAPESVIPRSWLRVPKISLLPAPPPAPAIQKRVDEALRGGQQ